MSSTNKPTLAEFIDACGPTNEQERDVVVRFYEQWNGGAWMYTHVRDVVRTLTNWARWTNRIGHRIAAATGEDLTPYLQYNAALMAKHGVTESTGDSPVEPEPLIEPKPATRRRYVTIQS